MRHQLRNDMSSHACAACQAKKAKCNGANPCDRCVLRKQPCHYTPKRRESKQSLRWEVDKLSRRQAAIDSVFALLRSDKHSSAVLEEIRRGEDVEDISVRCSDLHRSSLSDCPDDAETAVEDLSPGGQLSTVGSPGTPDDEFRGSFGDHAKENPSDHDKTPQSSEKVGALLCEKAHHAAFWPPIKGLSEDALARLICSEFNAILQAHGPGVSEAKDTISARDLVQSLTRLVYRGRLYSTPMALLGAYEQCLRWYEVASPLLLDVAGTLLGLLSHIYFHFCLVTILRPLLPHNKPRAQAEGLPPEIFSGQSPGGNISNSIGISPRVVCAEASQAVLTLAESCLLASDSASPYTTQDIPDPWLAPDTTSKTWVLLVYMVYATGLAQLQEVERWTPDSDPDSVPTTARLGPGADPALAASLRAMRLLRVMDGGRGSEAENMRKILADELHVLMGPSAPVENLNNNCRSV